MELTDLSEAHYYNIPRTPHHRSCLARCGATIASPLRGWDGKTPFPPAGHKRPRGGRVGIARGEHAIGVRNPGKRHPTQWRAVGARKTRHHQPPMRPAEAGHRFNSLGACPEVGATDDCSGSRRVSGPRARPTIRVLAGHVGGDGDQIRSHLPRVDVTGYV